jgi:hypothetical protein
LENFAKNFNHKIEGKKKEKRKEKNPAIQWIVLNLRPGFVTWIWRPGTCIFVPES